MSSRSTNSSRREPMSTGFSATALASAGELWFGCRRRSLTNSTPFGWSEKGPKSDSACLCNVAASVDVTEAGRPFMSPSSVSATDAASHITWTGNTVQWLPAAEPRGFLEQPCFVLERISLNYKLSVPALVAKLSVSIPILFNRLTKRLHRGVLSFLS